MKSLRKKAFFMIIFLAIAIPGGYFFYNYTQPENVATRKLEFLIKDYYENYYYNSAVDALETTSPEVFFAKYTERGLPIVQLRQLLLYNDGEHADYRQYFDGYCDTNLTYVRYYPVESFGKTDYRFEYKLSCNF